MSVDYNQVRYEVYHDYGGYTHTDIIDEFNSLEEAKTLFLECITSPDEWDDAYYIQMVNLNENDELIDESMEEYDHLDTFIINEYVDEVHG